MSDEIFYRAAGVREQKGSEAKGGTQGVERVFPPRRSHCLGRYSVSITALPRKFSPCRLLIHRSIGPSGILICCEIRMRAGRRSATAGGRVSKQAGKGAAAAAGGIRSRVKRGISPPCRFYCLDTALASPLPYGQAVAPFT